MTAYQSHSSPSMGTVNTVVANSHAGVESIWIRVREDVKNVVRKFLRNLVGISPAYQLLEMMWKFLLTHPFSERGPTLMLTITKEEPPTAVLVN